MNCLGRATLALVLSIVLILEGCAYRTSGGHQVWPPMTAPTRVPAPGRVKHTEQGVTVEADARLPAELVQEHLGVDARQFTLMGTLPIWISVRNAGKRPLRLRSREITLELADGRHFTPLDVDERAVRISEQTALAEPMPGDSDPTTDQQSPGPARPDPAAAQAEVNTPAEPVGRPAEGEEPAAPPSPPSKISETLIGAGAKVVGAAVAVGAELTSPIWLPAAAGLLVAVGIVASPFVVYSHFHNLGIEKGGERSRQFEDLQTIELGRDTEVTAVVHFGVDPAAAGLTGAVLSVPLDGKEGSVVIRIPLSPG